MLRTTSTKAAAYPRVISKMAVKIAQAEMALSDQETYVAMHVRDLSDLITDAVSKSGPVNGLLMIADKVQSLTRLRALHEVYSCFIEKIGQLKRDDSSQGAFDAIALEAAAQLVAASKRMADVENCDNFEKTLGTLEGLKKVIWILGQPV